MTRKSSLQRKSDVESIRDSRTLIGRPWHMHALQKKARDHRKALGKQKLGLRRNLAGSTAIQVYTRSLVASGKVSHSLNKIFGLLSAYGKAAPPANEIHDAIAEAMEEQEIRSRSSGPTS